MDSTTHPLATQLAPQAPGIELTDLVLLPGQVLVRLTATAPSACCPTCQHPSSDRHSRYTRTLADLPWGEHTVHLLLTVRKFRCSNPTCHRRVFTQRLPALVAPYARQTLRRQALLRLLGLALGGQAGAYLAAFLGLSTSRDSLLRLLGQTALPKYLPPRIIGIDDWALRRGRRFGTIVVDLEHQRPIALLPNRQPDTVIAWLQDHPTVEVVSRDRAEGYADAVRRGAPQARQIADRWHLLKNLTESIEAFLQNKRVVLNDAVACSTPPPPELATVAIPIETETTRTTARQNREQHYREQHEAVHRLHAQQVEVATIARQVGVSRTTVYNYLRMQEPPVGKQPVYRSAEVLEAYKPYLLERWAAGCRNAQQLLREIKEQGYAYSGRTLNR